MSNDNINFEGFANELLAEWRKYTDEVIADIKKSARSIMLQARIDVVQKSPENISKYKKDTLKYKDGWRTKVLKNDDTTIQIRVYQKNKPQLVHLLEDGHVGRDGERVQAFPHVKVVEDEATEKFSKKIDEILRREK